MKELRCNKCDKLLVKLKTDTVSESTKQRIESIEVKCPRCKTLNTHKL